MAARWRPRIRRRSRGRSRRWRRLRRPSAARLGANARAYVERHHDYRLPPTASPSPARATDRVTAHADLASAMAELIGVPPTTSRCSGRGASRSYAILAALGVGPGDEVIVPAFTCVAVPNAILYTGATPVYVDIDEASYTADPAAVAAALSPRTRIVLAQNTFGLSADVGCPRGRRRRQGAVVIDDCTHGLGGRTGPAERRGGARSVYSTQWSKPISTGLGGIAVTTDAELARELAAIERSAREPRALDRALLATMLLARERIATPRTLRAGRGVLPRRQPRRTACPALRAARSSRERRCLRPSSRRCRAFQARLAGRRLTTLAARVRRRVAVARGYSARLAQLGCAPAAEPESARHAFLRYPCAWRAPMPSSRRRIGAGCSSATGSARRCIRSAAICGTGPTAGRASGRRARGLRDRQPAHRRPTWRTAGARG